MCIVQTVFLFPQLVSCWDKPGLMRVAQVMMTRKAPAKRMCVRGSSDLQARCTGHELGSRGGLAGGPASSTPGLTPLTQQGRKERQGEGRKGLCCESSSISQRSWGPAQQPFLPTSDGWLPAPNTNLPAEMQEGPKWKETLSRP